MAGPGRPHRNGITLLQLGNMFPDEAYAHKWFESIHWPDGELFCLCCGSGNVYCCKHKEMPFRCRDRKKYFSVKTGMSLLASNLPLQNWVWAIYLESTSLERISSMKLHRDLGITQTTAWFMLQRIRAGLIPNTDTPEGPIEVGEAYLGGLEKNKHEYNKLNAGRGLVNKTTVVGMKDRATEQIRAQVIERTDGATLGGIVDVNAAQGAQLHKDSAIAYKNSDRPHQTVKHSVSEYVNGQARVNGDESFWAVLKRAYHGMYHHESNRHLNRYVAQFAGKLNLRNLDIEEQMQHIVASMVGRKVQYRKLIA